MAYPIQAQSLPGKRQIPNWGLLLTSLLLAGCVMVQPAAVPAAQLPATATDTPVPTVSLPTPTNTSNPTDTPAPTNTTIPTETPAPTDTPIPTEPPPPTETPTSPAVVAPVSAQDWREVASVEGEYYILGNPAAPVRMIDFSNFF